MFWFGFLGVLNTSERKLTSLIVFKASYQKVFVKGNRLSHLFIEHRIASGQGNVMLTLLQPKHYCIDVPKRAFWT